MELRSHSFANAALLSLLPVYFPLKGGQSIAQWFFPGERDERSDNENLD